VRALLRDGLVWLAVGVQPGGHLHRPLAGWLFHRPECGRPGGC